MRSGVQRRRFSLSLLVWDALGAGGAGERSGRAVADPPCSSTMVTAILPTMTLAPLAPVSKPPNRTANGSSHAVTPSISSEITITPARYRSQSPLPPLPTPTSIPAPPKASAAATSQLAGLVGMFTGLGALVALGIFLPLPARFQKGGTPPAAAVADSFYIVSGAALAVALACFFGLRRLPGEEHKGWRGLSAALGASKSADEDNSNINGTADPARGTDNKPLSYPRLLLTSLALGLRDADIALGYLGGFVARASSVAISLFIPLFVNAYFISSGRCAPGDRADIKRDCRRAYVLAASLSGASQLVALLCAPVFGALGARYGRGNVPLLAAAAVGVAGYAAFGALESPDPSSERGGPAVFLVVAALGVSQIGAIVCSLGLLGKGIQKGGAEDEGEAGGGRGARASAEAGGRGRAQAGSSDAAPADPPSRASAALRDPFAAPAHHGETEPLLRSARPRWGGGTGAGDEVSRADLKGSIAGVYSLAGGAGILLLTKAGGLMFDRVHPGAPFFLMAGFNGMLLIVGTGCAVWEVVRGRRRALEGE